MERINDSFANILVLLAGALLTLSFSPFNHSYLAVAALFALFYSWTGETPRTAALRGLLFGLGFFGSGASWIYFSVHDFSGASAVSAAAVALLFVLVLASFIAAAGYVCGKYFRGGHFADIALGYPAAWICAEYLRGNVVLNGFPWLQVGYSQEFSLLAGYIPICGVYGTGFLLALTPALLVLAARRKKHALRLCAGIAVLWAGGAALGNVQWTHPVGDAFKVTLIQGNIAQNDKWLPENRDKTLRMYREMSAEHWDSRLIVWPETAVPAFYDLVKDDFINPLQREAQRRGVDLIVPVPLRGENGGGHFNAVLNLGSHFGIYRKVHLVPFGEYLPLQPLSGKVVMALNAHIGDFAPGRPDQPLLEGAGYPYATSICYEDAFGVETLRSMPEAAFLVNVTNDSWFGEFLQPAQHMQMARLRAIETGRYLLRATNTGISAVVAPDGSMVDEAPQSQRYALTSSIVPMGGMTPYAAFGDKFIVYGLLSILAGLPVFRRMRKENCRCWRETGLS